MPQPKQLQHYQAHQQLHKRAVTPGPYLDGSSEQLKTSSSSSSLSSSVGSKLRRHPSFLYAVTNGTNKKLPQGHNTEALRPTQGYSFEGPEPVPVQLQQSHPAAASANSLDPNTIQTLYSYGRGGGATGNHSQNTSELRQNGTVKVFDNGSSVVGQVNVNGRDGDVQLVENNGSTTLANASNGDDDSSVNSSGQESGYGSNGSGSVATSPARFWNVHRRVLPDYNSCMAQKGQGMVQKTPLTSFSALRTGHTPSVPTTNGSNQANADISDLLRRAEQYMYQSMLDERRGQLEAALGLCTASIDFLYQASQVPNSSSANAHLSSLVQTRWREYQKQFERLSQLAGNGSTVRNPTTPNPGSSPLQRRDSGVSESSFACSDEGSRTNAKEFRNGRSDSPTASTSSSVSASSTSAAMIAALALNNDRRHAHIMDAFFSNNRSSKSPSGQTSPRRSQPLPATTPPKPVVSTSSSPHFDALPASQSTSLSQQSTSNKSPANTAYSSSDFPPPPAPPTSAALQRITVDVPLDSCGPGRPYTVPTQQITVNVGETVNSWHRRTESLDSEKTIASTPSPTRVDWPLPPEHVLEQSRPRPIPLPSAAVLPPRTSTSTVGSKPVVVRRVSVDVVDSKKPPPPPKIAPKPQASSLKTQLAPDEKPSSKFTFTSSADVPDSVYGITAVPKARAQPSDESPALKSQECHQLPHSMPNPFLAPKATSEHPASLAFSDDAPVVVPTMTAMPAKSALKKQTKSTSSATVLTPVGTLERTARPANRPGTIKKSVTFSEQLCQISHFDEPTPDDEDGPESPYADAEAEPTFHENGLARPAIVTDWTNFPISTSMSCPVDLHTIYMATRATQPPQQLGLVTGSNSCQPANNQPATSAADDGDADDTDSTSNASSTGGESSSGSSASSDRVPCDLCKRTMIPISRIRCEPCDRKLSKYTAHYL